MSRSFICSAQGRCAGPRRCLLVDGPLSYAARIRLVDLYMRMPAASRRREDLSLTGSGPHTLSIAGVARNAESRHVRVRAGRVGPIAIPMQGRSEHV